MELNNNNNNNNNNNDDDVRKETRFGSEKEIISLSGGMSSFQWHDPPQPRSQCVSVFERIAVGIKVKTPFGVGIVTQLPSDSNPSLEVLLDQWKLANEQSPTVYFRLQEHETSLEQAFLEQHGIQTCDRIRAQEILNDRRSMALDVSPVFCLASGRAVQGMLSSGVADYLEFKTIDGLYWLDGNNSMMRVPCSKNDVFQTKLLKPMDKRRLMKFIQLSMDYATQLASISQRQDDNGDKEQTKEAEDQVKSLNERHLNQGRSLARPQNKKVLTQEFETLQECLSADGSWTFQTFLEKKQKLSPQLLDIVRYALAWETGPTSTSLQIGMDTLQQHLQALGRYGTTAFLVPMYGSGELSQAFCRSAAVFGATYLLRRAPLGIGISSQKVDSVIIKGEDQEQNENQKKIGCSAVVAPTTCIPPSLFVSPPRRTKILRRISILNDKLIKSTDGEDRHVLFIPPKSKIGNPYTIHCVTLDETIHVAPRGCTIMHLTTTVECDDDSDIVDDSLLTKASQAILKAKDDKDKVKEVYHVSFSHEVVLPESKETETLPEGLFLCQQSGQVLTADSAFEQAQRIFSKICPTMEFLGLSDKLDACIKERAAERQYPDDDEKLMLESALGMIGGDEEA